MKMTITLLAVMMACVTSVTSEGAAAPPVNSVLLEMSSVPAEAGAEAGGEAGSEAAVDEAPAEAGGDIDADRQHTWGENTPDTAGVFIPYDKKLPTKKGVRYFTASGNQECALCADIVGASYKYGESYWDICSPVGASADMRPMCIAQMKTLQACPEFTNGWCYQDMGGTQQLRAPCPPHLICHYCLGLNPLHCV